MTTKYTAEETIINYLKIFFNQTEILIQDIENNIITPLSYTIDNYNLNVNHLLNKCDNL